MRAYLVRGCMSGFMRLINNVIGFNYKRDLLLSSRTCGNVYWSSLGIFTGSEVSCGRSTRWDLRDASLDDGRWCVCGGGGGFVPEFITASLSVIGICGADVKPLKTVHYC